MNQAHSLSRDIWQITWPAMVSNISIPLLGLADAAILGHLGDARYLAAVTLGSAVLSFVYWGFSFLRMGTTGLVAQAEGAGNTHQAQAVLARSILLALVIAAGVLASRGLWLPWGLALMSAEQDLEALAISYGHIRSYSAPAVLLTYAVIGWFIGRKNTRWPMVILVATNGTNIALDYLFVLQFGWQSDGAAWATVIAEYTGCALALGAALGVAKHTLVDALRRSLRSFHGYSELLRANRHLFVRTVTLLFSFAFFAAQGENFGTQTLAANSILIQLLFVASYGLDGFAYAAEALAGQAAGAGHRDQFFTVVRTTGWWCGLTALFVSVIFALAGPWLFSHLTNISEVETLLNRYHTWLVLLPLLAAPSYLLDGVFIGTSTTRPMMLTMLVSTLLVYLPVWYLTQSLDNHGLWLAFAVFSAARGLTLAAVFYARYRKGLWVRPISGESP